MKEQNKTPEKELKKMETSNQTDAEFKTLVIRMLTDLSENFNKEIGNIKIELESMKKNQSEIKNTLQSINNGVGEVEDQIRDLEDKEAEYIHPIRTAKTKKNPKE